MTELDALNGTEIVDSICSALKSMDPSQREELLEALRRMIEAERLGIAEASTASSCPDCGCQYFSKHGYTIAGKQRYRCDHCGRTFTDRPPGNLFRYTKLDDDQWYRFIECFVNGLTLRKSADICDVCLKTAWFMRFRVMELIHRNLPSFEIKNDIRTQIDEIYIPESFKGNMEKAGFIMPRKPYRHGQSSHPLGQTDKICVVTAINDLGDFFYEIACIGPFTRDAARATLSKSVAEGSIVVTDNLGSYVKALRQLKARHDRHDARDYGPLNRVNGLHALIRQFMRPFHGVSSKYLGLYLGWFKWISCYGKGSLSETSDKLSVQMVNGEYTHRRSMLKDIVFPFRKEDGRQSTYPVC